MPLPQSFAQASAAVGDNLTAITKKIEEAPGRCATLNELHDWWVQQHNRELRDLKDGVKYMLENGFATAKTVGNTKLVTLTDFAKKDAPPPQPQLAAPSKIEPIKVKPPKPVDDRHPIVDAAPPTPTPTEAADDWCTAAEAAQLLGVGKNHLSYYARNKSVVTRNVGRGAKIARYLYSRASIMELAKQNKNSPKFAASQTNGRKNKKDDAPQSKEKAVVEEDQSAYKTDLAGGLELRFYLSRGQHEILARLVDTGLYENNKTSTAKLLLCSMLRRLRRFTK